MASLFKKYPLDEVLTKLFPIEDALNKVRKFAGETGKDELLFETKIALTEIQNSKNLQMQIAVDENRPRDVNLLLSSGAEIAFYRTQSCILKIDLFDHAARLGRVEICQIFSSHGHTLGAMLSAINAGQLEIVKILRSSAISDDFIIRHATMMNQMEIVEYLNKIIY